MIVWVVESHEDRACFADSVYASLDAAVAGIKAKYLCPPYPIEWGPLRPDGPGCHLIIGQITGRVDGLCIPCQVVCGVREFEVIGL